jgi:type II secretory pathway component GspD/PulD (secretin)
MDAMPVFFNKVTFDMSFFGFTGRRRMAFKPVCRLAMSLAMFYAMLLGVLVDGSPIARAYALSQDPNELNPAQGDPNAPSPPNGAPGAGAPGAPGAGAPGSGAPGAGAPKDSATLKRPTEPKQAPNPRAFDIKPDEQGMIQFQFRDQAWPDVLQWVADVSGLALDWQELPSDLLSIATPGKASLSETRDMINRHLLARGFTMLEFPGVLQVVKTKEVNASLIPRFDPEELESLPANRFVRTTYKLDTLIAKDLIEELKQLISANGSMRALSKTNRLEAMDTAANLAEIHRIISQEQSDEVLNNLAREFELQHVRATDVREQLAQFLKLEPSKNSNPQPGRMSPEEMEAQQQMMMQQQLAQQQGRQGAPKPATPSRAEVYLIANTRRNSIIVNAPPDKMAIVAAFITRVDVSNPDEDYQALTTRMKVYRLTSLDPKQFVSSLMALNVLEPTTRLEADDKNKSMIAYASLADHLTIQETLKKLDGSARQAEVIALRRLRADEVAGTIRMLMGVEQDKKDDNQRRNYFSYDFYNQRNKETSKDMLRIGVNAESNQLILWANEYESEEIKKLLLKLGELPPEARSDQRVRTIDGNRSEQMREYLERLKRTFDQKGIELEIPAESEFKSDEPTDKAKPSDPDKPVPKAPELIQIGANEPKSKSHDATRTNLFVATETTQQSGNSDVPGKSDAPGKSAVAGKSAVKIRFDEQGNLVLESDDTKALDQLEEWMISNTPPEKEYDVFQIRHARAYWIKLNLEEYFKDDSNKKNDGDVLLGFLFGMESSKRDDDGPQLGKKRKLKLMSDSDSNTLLISGASPSQLKTIQRLVDLWDKPEKQDKQNLRYTKTVKVEYSKAQNVADAIKDAFRDLLSSNDKALARGQKEPGQAGAGKESKHQSEDSISEGGMNYDFSGKLSLGVDAITNTIIVSAKGEDLLKLVCDMVQELDLKAKRNEAVEVLAVGGTSTIALEKALKNLLRPQNGMDPNARAPQNLKLSPEGQGGLPSNPQRQEANR